MLGREQQSVVMESKVGSGFDVKRAREHLSGEAMSKPKERSEKKRGPSYEKKQSLCYSLAEGKHLVTSRDRGRRRGWRPLVEEWR